jgi:hypothetical protein
MTHNFGHIFTCRCKRDLRSSGIVRSVEWYLCTDVSRQPIGPSLRVKIGPIGCPETSVHNYHITLRRFHLCFMFSKNCFGRKSHGDDNDDDSDD